MKIQIEKEKEKYISQNAAFFKKKNQVESIRKRKRKAIKLSE